MLQPVRSVRCLVLASLLQLLVPKNGRGDGAVSYKIQSWQEDADRIRVDSQYGSAEQSLPAEAKIRLSGVIDTITGATPTGQLPAVPNGPVPMTEIHDRRKAWQADLSKSFGRMEVSLGGANSRESDYVSDGWSFNTLTNFNQKNTTVLVGLAGTSDEVKVFFQTPWAHKRNTDAVVGVTQLLGPNTSVTFNLTYGKARGYLSDPYKLIEKRVDLGGGLILLRTFGENRPDEREKWIAFASINQAAPGANGALEGSYRYYRDNYGIASHTLTLEWFQKLWRDRLILRPSLRWYEQGSADFYRLTLDGTTITPGKTPDPRGPFYSADYRLSKMRTLNCGAKLVFVAVPDRLTVDVSYERYAMYGRDSVTSPYAYATAHVFTGGARFSW